MECKGICPKYKAQKTNGIMRHRYAAGQKYCRNCEKFLGWEGLWCPCCGAKLRTRRHKNIPLQEIKVKRM